MTDGNLPHQMSSLRVNDAEDLEPDDRQVGSCLTRYAVRYLQDAIDGLSSDMLLQQLEDLDARAFRAWTLHRVGRTNAQIAKDDKLQCSERTVKRLLAVARHILASADTLPDPTGLTYEQRLTALERHRPRAFHVYLMNQYHWRLDAVAAQLGISESTVKRAISEAREYLGDYDRRVSAHFAATLIEAAELNHEERLARRRALVEDNKHRNGVPPATLAPNDPLTVCV
jgi:DNA-directed RNA polymerase specialized sigma24 family protein